MILLVELLGSAPDLTDRLRVSALVDSVASTEDQGSETRATMGKLRLILSELHKMMFPLQEVPTGLEDLIKVFLGTPALVEFSRAQTLSRAEAVLTLAGAHEVNVDFHRVFSNVPTDEQGSEVNLEPFAAAAKPLAEQLLEFMERRAKELEELEEQERVADAAQENTHSDLGECVHIL